MRDLLLARQSGGIIFTTVQKFSLLGEEEIHPALSERSNIVVISDEAHRSQYGLKAVLGQVRDSVRAKLRNLVRITLRRYKYPPDKTPEAVELVLKQAEVLSNQWSVESA